MARIPEFRRRPVGQVSSNRLAQSQQIGQTVARLGQSISDTGFTLMEVEAKNYTNEKAIEMEQEYASIQREWSQENQESPLGATKKLEEKLNATKEKYVNNAPNAFAKKRMDDVFSSMKGSYMMAGQKWERETLVKQTGATAKKGIESRALKAYEQGISTLDNVLREVDPLAEPLKQVTDKVIYDETVLRGKRSVALSAFESEIDNGNVEVAAEMLKSKKYNEILGVDGVKAINKRINARRKTSEESKQKLDKLRLTKPYEFYDKVGEDVPDVNVLDSANLANSLEKRFIHKEELDQKYATNSPLFKETELLQLKTFDENGTVEERVNFYSQVRDSVPSQYSGMLAGELFQKEPAKAMAYNVVADDKDLATEIIQGDDLLKSKTFTVNNNEFLSIVTEKLGNAIENPDAMRQISQGAKALYAKRASESGFNELNTAAAEKAIEDIIGPTAEINGRKTLSFKNKENEYLDTDDLEDLMEGITPKFLDDNKMPQAVMGNGEPVDWELVADEGKLIALGEGRYNVVMPTRNGDSALVDKNGNMFTLDLKALNEVMDRRGVTTRIMDDITNAF